MKVYPDMVQQELKAETLEGMAEYVGLKALQIINYEKFIRIVKKYISQLRKQDSLLFDVRRISYYSGAIYYLCCDNNNIILHNDFVSEQTVYEQNPINIDGIIADIKHFDFIPRCFADLISEREKLVAQHIEKGKYIACKAFICGYDPMNMFRVGDFIYCKYFVCLNMNGTIQNINSSVVLKMDENSNQNIVGYYSVD